MWILNVFKRINLSPIALFSFLFVVALVASLSTSMKFTEIALYVFVIIAFCALITALALAIARKNARGILLVFLLIFGIVLGFFRGYLHLENEAFVKNDGGIHHIVGRVDRVLYRDINDASYEITVYAIDGKEHKTKMKIDFDYDAIMYEFDAFSAYATFNELSEYNGGFNERKYYLSKGIKTHAKSTNYQTFKLYGTQEDLEYDIYLLRENISEMITESVGEDEEASGFLSAILLGKSDAMPYEMRRDFSAIGLAHIFAVSGLHLSIIIGAIDLLLRKITLHRQIKNLVLIGTIVFFVIICGASKSILRASVMLIIYYLSFYFGERSDSRTSLLIALAVICAASPNSVFDTGLRLSFFATLGIVTLGERLRNIIKQKFPENDFLTRMKRRALYMLSTTFSAVLFTIPTIFVSFFEISLFSPLSNMIAAAFIPFIIVLTLLIIAFSPIAPISTFLGFVAVTAVDIFADIAAFFGKNDFFVVSLKFDAFIIAVALAVVIIIAFTFLKIKKAKYVLTSVIGFILVFASLFTVNLLQSREPSVIYSSISPENEVLVITQNKKALIIDMTNGGYSKLYEACNIAKENSSRPKAIMLTSYEESHIKSMDRILKSYYFDEIYFNAPSGDLEMAVFERIRATAASLGIKGRICNGLKDTNVQFMDTCLKFVKHKNEHGRRFDSLTLAINEKKIIYVEKSFGNIGFYNADYIIFGDGGKYPINKVDLSNFADKGLIFARESVLLKIAENVDKYPKDIYFADKRTYKFKP